MMTISAAGSSLPWMRGHAALNKMAQGPETPVILAGVSKGSGEQCLIDTVKKTARSATDFSWLSRGDSVLIKPAANSGNPYPATTSSGAIRAMVELLKEKGASRIIVMDMSGVEHVKLTPEKLRGSSRKLMNKNGMAKAALEAGAEIFFPEEKGWNAFVEEEPADSSHWKKGILMPKILKEIDHIILMPRCGRHTLLGSSLGMKCAVGYWRTDTRLEYHRYAADIQEKTADANTVPSINEKQRLVITAATRILTTFGPDRGFVSAPDTGLVIASGSIVAHDMVSLAWLLQNRAFMSEQEMDGAFDPYERQFLVNNANRYVVMLLGGLRDVWNAERLLRNDIESIWDDRVLNRAFEIYGGIPKINLVEINPVPADIKKKLREMVTKQEE